MDPIITLTVKSTHFYLINCKGGKLLVDAGWELPQFTSQLKSYKIPITDIKYVMFTHTHPDHAGLIQTIKKMSGARLIIHEKQIPFLEELRAFAERKGGVEPIQVAASDLISPDRKTLQSIGIQGEIVETPGHSDDSITLALDSGEAFIGDLTSPAFITPENSVQLLQSWQTLLDRNVQVFYHSHTPPIPAEQIRGILASLNG